jgi:hypothetical protein
MKLVKSTYALFEAYLRDDFPKLVTNGPIVYALGKHGELTPAKVTEALTWSKGPSIRVSGLRGNVFESWEDAATNTITISGFLARDYDFFREWWNAHGKTPAKRDKLDESWTTSRKSVGGKPVWHRPHSILSFHDMAFVTTTAGQRVWIAGAILLESLVRLGVRKKGKTYGTAADMADRFSTAVYGAPVVKAARENFRNAFEEFMRSDPMSKYIKDRMQVILYEPPM